MNWIVRILKPALYVNAVIVTIVAVVIFFLHSQALTKAEPILSTRMGGLFLAFAVTCVVVAAGYQQDRRLLLIPMVVNLAEFANAVVQLAIQVLNVNLPTDPVLAPPLILTGVFSVFYVLAYLALGSRTSD